MTAGKTVLVTGGASGIGAATALRFGRAGWQVVVADSNARKAQQVVEQLSHLGGTGFVLPVDLADEAAIAACGVALAQRVETLQALVNNAGIVRTRSIAETSHADWDLQVAVNLRAPALMAQALLPLLRAAKGAAIVNVSSEAAFRPRPNSWVYDASKAAICALTRTMACEFYPYGIRANTVAPGWTVTEMHFAQAVDPAARKRELEEKEIDGCILRRLGRPEEIANAIFFLASDEASYITATTLHVDGGRVAH